MARRVVEVKRAEGRRRLRVVVAATAALVTAAVGVGVAESPLGRVRHVRVTGAGSLSPAQVAGASGIGRSARMISLDTGAASKRLEALPVVATAQVIRQWPATVRISLTERRPVAEVAVAGAVLVVDPSGRVLTRLAAVGAASARLGSSAGAPGIGAPIGQLAPPVGLPGVVVPGSLVGSTAPGSWLDVAGPEARAALAGELALAGALPHGLDGRIGSLAMGPAGLTGRIGATTVLFGGTGLLEAQVAALEGIEAATPLGAAGTLDLTVPDRPVLNLASPGAPTTLTAGGSTSTFSTQARG